MSNTIREYLAGLSHFPDAKNMLVTATMQGKWGHGVQFTVGDEYIVLAENQIKDLIAILRRRLRCDKGYSATDTLDEVLVVPPIEKEAEK